MLPTGQCCLQACVAYRSVYRDTDGDESMSRIQSQSKIDDTNLHLHTLVHEDIKHPCHAKDAMYKVHYIYTLNIYRSLSSCSYSVTRTKYLLNFSQDYVNIVRY